MCAEVFNNFFWLYLKVLNVHLNRSRDLQHYFLMLKDLWFLHLGKKYTYKIISAISRNTENFNLMEFGKQLSRKFLNDGLHPERPATVSTLKNVVLGE